MTATTFDPARKSNTTLSGGNLTASSTGSGGCFATRALSGLTYFEVTVTTVTGTVGVGIANSNWNLAQLGIDASSIGYLSSGIVQFNGATLATLTAYTSGARIDVAVDPFQRLIWFRLNNGNWNGAAGNNPATSTGGLSYAITTANVQTIATALPAICYTLSGAAMTANFSGAFTDVAPTGYITADTIQYTTMRTEALTEVPPLVAMTFSTARAAELPSDNRTVNAFAPAGPITVVSGTTKENGSAVAGKLVEVFDRLTGDRLGFTYSDVSGNWSIPCLGRPSVRVVGSDPTTYNSVVYDNVVPV